MIELILAKKYKWKVIRNEKELSFDVKPVKDIFTKKIQTGYLGEKQCEWCRNIDLCQTKIITGLEQWDTP